MSDFILFNQHNCVGQVTLNRSHALNALDLQMCERLKAQLLAWRNSHEMQLVMLDHAEGRSFCAGGDIRALAEQGRHAAAMNKVNVADQFFFSEYQMNHLLFTYRKKTLAFMDGITMGGGVGLALPCQYRIATENTRFAMPETGIGLFPDVGGGWYLPRLQYNFGYFLALTGLSIGGADCLYFGLATHYIKASRLPELKQLLIRYPESVQVILDEYSYHPDTTALFAKQQLIQKIFAHRRCPDVLQALEQEGSDWAKNIAEVIRQKSPLAIQVTLQLFAQSLSKRNFAAQLQQEFVLACNMVRQADFYEGVRAVLIDKDHRPKWQHSNVDAVPVALVEHLLSQAPRDLTWYPIEI